MKKQFTSVTDSFVSRLISQDRVPIVVLSSNPNFIQLFDDSEKCDHYLILLSSNIEQAEKLLIRFCPKLVVIDLSLPQSKAFEFINYIRRSTHKNIAVISLVVDSKSSQKIQALSKGADVCLSLPILSEELWAQVEASIYLYKLRRGEVNTERLSQTLNQMKPQPQLHLQVQPIPKAKPRSKPQSVDNITPQQRQILKYLSLGLTTKAIAKNLELSPRTVEKHISMMLAKTKAQNRVQLTEWFADLKLT